MIEPHEQQEPNEPTYSFSSDAVLVELDESNTKPGKPSAKLRAWMEAKWGRTNPPANGSAEKPKDA